LFDERGRNDAAVKQQIPQEKVDLARTLLEVCNPYLGQLQTAIASINSDEYVIELDQPAAGGKVAAIINVHNLNKISKRKVIIRQREKTNSDFIDIHSQHYEPLQYLIFFPHGSVGWSRQHPLRLTQIQWYRARLLTERRFQQLARLTCEYLVDMYSRVEEEPLQYI
jgi:hypothetical protein